MPISVRAAAERLELSEQRVRQLLAAGELAGQRISGRWIVDDAAMSSHRRMSRPLSVRMAWALINELSGLPVRLHDMERRRIQGYRNRLELAAPGEVSLLLSSWLSKRAHRLRLSIAAADLADLRADPRFIASGLSAQEAKLAAGSEAEGYVLESDIDAVRGEFLLVDSDRANVWLHVVKEPHDWGAVRLVLVAADLADHGGPRESARAAEIFAGIRA